MIRIFLYTLLTILTLTNCIEMYKERIRNISLTDIASNKIIDKNPINGRSLYSILRKPKSIDGSSKMLVLLHGVGCNEKSIMELVDMLP